MYTVIVDDHKKEIEELKTEIVSLKIRIRRLEEFHRALPNPSDYIEKRPESESSGRDEFFEEAVRLVSQYESASSSMLQRRLQIGFNRSARLLEQLEEAGAVGPGEGSKPRKVLFKNAEEFLQTLKK